jgi:tetratricopeptide (TPR) repeat protein
VRVIEVKVVADQGYQLQPKWELRVKKNILSAQRIFRKNFGIRIHIQKFGYWCSNPSLTTMEDLIKDLMGKIPRGECDIVLGLIPSGRHNCLSYGISSYPHGYMLLQDIKSNATMKLVLKHELCHLFGAVDLKHEGSIMDMHEPGLEFDEFTRKLITVNRYRSFGNNEFPLDESQVDQSISLLKERVSLGQGEAEVQLILAFLLLEKGEYESALIESRRAISLNPALDGIHHSLGISYQGRGETDRAVEEYQKALRLQPNQTNIHFNLGLAYMEKGQENNAINAYRKALEFDPGNFLAHANLGCIYLKRGESDQAIMCCRKALEANPKLIESLCTLGAALIFKSGEVAGETFISDYFSENSHTSVNKQREIYEDNKITALLEEAKFVCRKASSLKPDLPEPHNILGATLAYLGDRKNAEAEFQMAIKLRPEYLAAHFNLGLLHLKNEGYEKSATHFSKTVEIATDFALGYQKLAEVFLAMSKNYSQYAEEKGWEKENEAGNAFIFTNVTKRK